jgi:ribosome-associated translation inhibitor RaiA
MDRWEQTGYHCEEDQQAIDSVYEVLESTVDKFYAKIEKAQAKQPTMEWD